MNDNLMFWVEWVKLTGEQKRNLLPYITDDGMLYEIAITSAGLRSDDLIRDAINRIKDDTMVVKLAAEVLPRCADSIVNRLGKSAWMLFDNDRASLRMTREGELMTSIMHGMDLNGLSNYCSANIWPTVRMRTFDNVVLRMTHTIDNVDEYNQHLSLLQKMVMTEPESDIRERMRGTLDRLTEDHI